LLLLQLAASAGEISGNGTGLNVVRHVDNEVAQGFFCGLIREAVATHKRRDKIEDENDK
jgi:hypothetical protein